MPANSPSNSSRPALNRSSRPSITNSAGQKVAKRRRKLQSRPPTRTSLYKYVRRVAGNKWQARVYVHFAGRGQYAGAHINLGLYDCERSAWMAVRDYVRTGKRPAHLLPRYVRRTAQGKYLGSVKLAGLELIATKPQDTPQEADAAMRRELRRVFGKAGLLRFYPFG